MRRLIPSGAAARAAAVNECVSPTPGFLFVSQKLQSLPVEQTALVEKSLARFVIEKTTSSGSRGVIAEDPDTDTNEIFQLGNVKDRSVHAEAGNGFGFHGGPSSPRHVNTSSGITTSELRIGIMLQWCIWGGGIA